MKIALYAVLSLLAVSGSQEFVVAGGKTGACTNPTGTITFTPKQTCGGTNVVAIGKQLTLTAADLKDKDCNCGKAVWDTISDSNIKWVVASGSLSQTTGSSVTWTAPTSVASGVKVSLDVKDDATAEGILKISVTSPKSPI